MKIAILDDYNDAALAHGDWGRLKGRADIEVFRAPLGDAAAQRLKPFEILVAMRERQRFPRELLAQLPNLKLIAQTGMGVPHIDLAAAKEFGIAVCGTRGDGTMAAEAEHTWALILGAVRHVANGDASIREGGWDQKVGARLSGKTLGVIGLGNIGARVARVGIAFGMEVIAWSTNLTAERAKEVGATLVSKTELLRRADVVTIHLKLGPRSTGLLGAQDLAQMKRTAILVNTSRGPIVDEKALLAALDAGTIGGAALDVFDIEPLPEAHPMRRAPRTLLTPHVGYVADDNYNVFYGQSVENIAAFLDGKPTRVIT